MYCGLSSFPVSTDAISCFLTCSIPSDLLAETNRAGQGQISFSSLFSSAILFLVIRSDLFTSTINRAPLLPVISPMPAAMAAMLSAVSVASATASTTSAALSLLRVLSIPSSSISSPPSLSPAVSMNLKRSPPRCRTSSIVSRVVPGISETMARSSCSRRFRSEDLPTFGLPAITTGIPFLMALPSRNEEASLSTMSLIFITVSVIAKRLAN